MLYTRECCECGEQFYMDHGVRCSACKSEFCEACDLDNTIWILTKNGHVKLCKSCIREYKVKGVEWLKNKIWADTSNFDEQQLIESIKKFEKRLSIR